MRWDGTEGRVACGPLSGSFNQNITRSADDGSRGHSRTAAPSAVGRSVGRSLLCRLTPSPPTIGGWVGLPRSPAITLRLFVSFGWRRCAGQNDDLCGPPLQSGSSPLFILGTKRKMDRRFQRSRRKEHKKGTRTRKGWTSEVYGKVAAALCAAKGELTRVSWYTKSDI